MKARVPVLATIPARRFRRIAHAHMCARGWRVFCLRAYSATPLACDESDFGCRARDAKIADPVDRAFQNNEKSASPLHAFVSVSSAPRLPARCRLHRAAASTAIRRRPRRTPRRRWPRNARTSCTSWPTISAIPTSMHSAARSTRRTSTRSSRRPHPVEPSHGHRLRDHACDAGVRHRPPSRRRRHDGRADRRTARAARLRGLPERPCPVVRTTIEGRRLPHVHRGQVAHRLGDRRQRDGQRADARPVGFERSYVLLGGAATNHFAHEPAGSSNYTEDGRYVQPGQPRAARAAARPCSIRPISIRRS